MRLSTQGHQSRNLRPAKWGSKVTLRGGIFEPSRSATGPERRFNDAGDRSGLPLIPDVLLRRSEPTLSTITRHRVTGVTALKNGDIELTMTSGAVFHLGATALTRIR
jgi:hypothetical protein